MALVSVIVPCYKVEKYIDRLVESLICQTIGFENVELICVDDASPDNTLERLKCWEERYPDNIMVVACETNGRQGSARNIGLGYASSDYVMFIDADDWVEPTYIKILYDEITRHELQVVTCGIRRDSSEELTYFNDVNEDGKKTLIIVDNDTERKKMIMYQPFGGACCKIISKRFLEEHNLLYPEGLAYEDLYWREIFHLYVTRGMVLDLCLYHYYVNPDSTTLKKNESYHFDYFTIATMLWNYWDAEGFLERYRSELEYEYIIIAGLQIMKVLILRYDEPQYSLFQLLQNLIRQRIPSINNRYINENYFSENQLILINSLYLNMTRAEFEAFIEMAQRIGI